MILWCAVWKILVRGCLVGPGRGVDGVGGSVCNRFSRRLNEYVCRKVCINRGSGVPGIGNVHYSIIGTLGRVNVPILH